MSDNLKCIQDYYTLIDKLRNLDTDERVQLVRHLARTDLFFLIWFVLRRGDIARPFLFDRCREVQKSPDDHLDLWARDHYKSTIITFALSIQDILSSHGDNPDPRWGGREATIGIFSCTRPLAKGFLRQIKREFEQNEMMRNIFPDIVWDNPSKEAPKWSEDDGIVLKRKGNPKESTVEAWGVVDGQPTGRHFGICVYDDIVTIDSVRSPHMIDKVTSSWELSLNLSTKGGITRYIGTRYHFNDTYKVIMDRQAAKARIYTATNDGTFEGVPVMLTRAQLDDKRRKMGIYTFSAQMLQNPVADTSQGFKQDWIMYYDYNNPDIMNKYILVDPANSKNKNSDYTAIFVIGLGQDENYYILEMIRDRMNLTERTKLLFDLHHKWKPLEVGYEQYGMQADINHIKHSMGMRNYHFNIIELGGKLGKNDRIRQLIPLFESGKIYFPYSCMKTDYEGIVRDMVQDFIHQEYLSFPVSQHDDMLDCLARILDSKMNLMWPKLVTPTDKYSRDYLKRNTGWAA